MRDMRTSKALQIKNEKLAFFYRLYVLHICTSKDASASLSPFNAHLIMLAPIPTKRHYDAFNANFNR